MNCHRITTPAGRFQYTIYVPKIDESLYGIPSEEESKNKRMKLSETEPGYPHSVIPLPKEPQLKLEEKVYKMAESFLLESRLFLCQAYLSLKSRKAIRLEEQLTFSLNLKNIHLYSKQAFEKKPEKKARHPLLAILSESTAGENTKATFEKLLASIELKVEKQFTSAASIAHLNLSHNPFVSGSTILNHFKYPFTLVRLDLSNTATSSTLFHFLADKCEALRELFLDDCPQVTAELLEPEKIIQFTSINIGSLKLSLEHRQACLRILNDACQDKVTEEQAVTQVSEALNLHHLDKDRQSEFYHEVSTLIKRKLEITPLMSLALLTIKNTPLAGLYKQSKKLLRTYFPNAEIFSNVMTSKKRKRL